jgi:PPK2 family polyphosphate:nucleotide phosphotransferase
VNTEQLRVRPGHRVHLADLDPRDTLSFEEKSEARGVLQNDVERLTKLQETFAAARTRALLVVLQGMDSAGKDGVVKHVMSGLNPQGVAVYSFKTPNDEELAHDFLWRTARVLPERGRIGIFNRSHYEEVVVVRVHADEMLPREGLAPSKNIWAERFDDINAFERHLVRNNTAILKFFLHLSKNEQRKRLLKRLDDENKNWKFSVNDIHERRYWDEYQTAYEEAINATSTESAPWYVIPADRKWFTRTAIANIVVQTLESLHPHYPHLTGEVAGQLEQFRQQLESE